MAFLKPERLYRLSMVSLVLNFLDFSVVVESATLLLREKFEDCNGNTNCANDYAEYFN